MFKVMFNVLAFCAALLVLASCGGTKMSGNDGNKFNDSQNQVNSNLANGNANGNSGTAGGLANGNASGASGVGGGPGDGNLNGGTGTTNGTGPGGGILASGSGPNGTPPGQTVLGKSSGIPWEANTVIHDFGTLEKCKLDILANGGDWSICMKCFNQWLSQNQSITAQGCGCWSTPGDISKTK